MAVSYKDINELDKRQVLSGEEKIPVSDMEYMDVAQIAKYVEAQSGKKYASLERLGPFLFKITFDSLPEDNGGETPISGGCSSYVQDGKLYRNLDFNYDKVAEFKVIAKEFEGMSFIPGLNDGDLDEDLFAQLPYRVNDGVNRQGIKVSTHVLFNDWEWTGTGDKSIPLTRLPFLILSKVKSMATIADDLSGILNNVTSTEGLDAMGYLIQFLVTDGITSYAILPPTSEGEPYVLQNITSNPKLANFRWVNSQTVTRDQLQTRPTGVERFNLMPCPLSELRFTKAYEAPTRLSEFIGIDDTTKDSTDEELEAIYNRAHALYLDRERDGQTWQTLHSVVYGDKIESLHVQENYIDNYAEVTKDYVDEEIARVEAEIPAKVSDLENDSEFQTGTEVDIKVAAEKTRAEAAESALDASKVDKVVGKGLSSNDYTTTEKQKLAGLENYDDTSITGRATALEGQVNKVVLNGMTASEDGSTVKLSLAKINIKTGATSSVDVPLPVVDANGAGILNPQTYQTIISNQTLINAIIGASVAVSGLAAEPTQAQVTNAWLTASGLEELVNGARLFDVTNTKVWTYYTNTELWYPVEAEGGGSVVIAQWTNSALGTVKGVADNAGHTNDGKLTAETDGTGSVLGWDRLIARVQTIESKEADWDGKQDALSEDQLAAVNSGITAPKLTALEQKVGELEDASPIVLNGTAMTSEQFDLLWDYARTIVLYGTNSIPVFPLQKEMMLSISGDKMLRFWVCDTGVLSYHQYTLAHGSATVEHSVSEVKDLTNALLRGDIASVINHQSTNAIVAGAKAVYEAIHPDFVATIPASGAVSNRTYRLGTVTGEVVIALAAPADDDVDNFWHFTFTTDENIISVTWPSTMNGWSGNCLEDGAPKIVASKHYEVDIDIEGYGFITEF